MTALSTWIVVTLPTIPSARVCAQSQAERAGTGANALAGVHEVPLAVPQSDGIRARVGASYGWTEPVLDLDDTHHRVQLDAAGSLTPLPWLAAALRVQGRYDAHSGGVDDDGAVTETQATARATLPLGDSVFAGADLSLWAPGGDTAGDGFAALSSDLQFLLAYAPTASPLTLGLSLGIRIDRSKYAGGDPETYSAADRLALGVSDSIFAARQGLAVSYRTGRTEWVAEWSSRLYFKSIAESPMWLRAGARYRPAPRLQLELLVGLSPSQRPSLADGAALAVVEPRLAAGFSATYTWRTDEPQPIASEVSAPKAAEEPPKPQLSVRGRVLTPTRTGLAGATVALRQGDIERAATTDAEGGFAFQELAPGAGELTVTADGFVKEQRALELRDGDRQPLELALERELPQGQIRGTVRRWNGKPLVASVAIPDLGITRQTRDDGTFEIDVAPGEYSVTVKARGFKSQTRKAKVEQQGVAILVVELETAR